MTQQLTDSLSISALCPYHCLQIRGRGLETDAVLLAVGVVPSRTTWIYVRIRTAYKTSAIIGIIGTRRLRVWLMIGKFEEEAEEEDSIIGIEEIVHGLLIEITVHDQGIIDHDLETGQDLQ